ncbi:MAG: nickel-type superoxide dismutase maturation protease, partial [Acidimicrobiales bacterium]
LAAAALAGAWSWWRPRRVQVEGPSMRPALQPGDRLLVVRRRGRPPAAGDVVALRDPTDRRRLLVKRVAAVASSGVTVLGDNTGASTDSRSFGAVPPGSLLGRAVYRYAPASRVGRLRRDAPPAPAAAPPFRGATSRAGRRRRAGPTPRR